MSVLEIDHDGSIAVVTMTHAERRNALSVDMLEALIGSLADATAAGCRALVLRAESGVSVWSAGHDIDDLPRDGRDPLTWTSPVEKLLRLIRGARFPVIAAVEGGAWGAACNLAFACDILVATRSATFAITPAKLGLPYNTDGTAQFLAAVPLNVAKEMFFTAEPISAERAHSYGVVNRLAETSADLEEVAMSMARRISDMAPLSIAAIKAEMTALTDARNLTSGDFEHLTSLRRDAWRSRDFQEGIDAFHERRAPRFTGQ